jgi:choline transport protein
MVGAAVIFLQTSCALPQAILLWRGRDKVLPERAFSLGRLGPTINFISVMWVVFLDIIFFLPTEMPVTKQNMNYVSAVSIGLTLFVLGLYFFSKRGQFNGPRVLAAHMQRVDAVPARGHALDQSEDLGWEKKE